MSDVQNFIRNCDLLLSHNPLNDAAIDQQFLLVLTTLLEPKRF